MPAVPCANHPNEMTFVRCGRCEKPICVQCMVDSPVGKKCRDCVRSRTHITESTPKQVLMAFLAATAVALPAGWLMAAINFIIAPFIYGGLVADVALRAGQRRRSLAMQAAAGLAALIGGAAGVAMVRLPQLSAAALEGLGPAHWAAFLGYPAALVIVGVVVAVSRVRFL